MPNLYEFKMSLFNHGKPEEFLFLIQNLNTNIEATGTLDTDAKIQYLCTLVRGEAFCQFDFFPNDVENIETLNVDYSIKGLALYLPPVNSLSKQKRVMHCGIHSLKVRRYAARLIDLNEYLAYFSGATLSYEVDVTELNVILLNSMPNSWSKQDYVHGFDYESILFKKVVNKFERMEITESIYKNLVESSY